MGEFLEINSMQKKLLEKLKEANSIINFKYDVKSYTPKQRRAFAEIITPLVYIGTMIKKAIALLEGQEEVTS